MEVRRIVLGMDERNLVGEMVLGDMWIGVWDDGIGCEEGRGCFG